MSKRRVFDIDFPGDETQEATSVPAGTAGSGATEHRRGPMAAAITENADALRERAEAEQSIREENDRLAHEHVRLKKQGLITDLIPLDAIHATKLTRDRSGTVDPDIAELKESIRAIGLSNPIRVEPEGDGYQLVQGFRRLSAFRELYAETGEEAFARIPAGLIAHGEALEGLYRRMVDENLVRRDLSFAEMAQLALAYARDPETSSDTKDGAIARLYASAGRQKRNYILHFANLLELVGESLRFVEAIPRSVGLQVEKKLSQSDSALEELRSLLSKAEAKAPEEELAVLRHFVENAGQGSNASRKPAPSSAKTTLKCAIPGGTVRCSARNGKVELATNRDFSSVDRHRLEKAVAAFMAALEG